MQKKIKITIAAAQLPLMNLTWILSFFFFFFRIFTRMQSRTKSSRIVNRNVSVYGSRLMHSCLWPQEILAVWVCDHNKILAVCDQRKSLQLGFFFCWKNVSGFCFICSDSGFFSFFCWCVLQQRGLRNWTSSWKM
jgi:hypothetical protein